MKQIDRAASLATTFNVPVVVMRRALELGCPVSVPEARAWLRARGMVEWKQGGKSVLLHTT
jgi:hypothetical protein